MNKPRVILHVIMPEQISGPNTAVRLLSESQLAETYDFGVAAQTFHAGGKVNLALIRDMRRQIKLADPDLVHLSGLQASGFHAVVAARLATQAPILITIRGFSVDSLSISKLQRAIFGFLIEPITLALCTGFVTVTHVAGRRRLVRLFRRKYLGAVHNAAPNWSFDPLDTQSTRLERRRLGLPESAFIATVSGRMVADKGIATALDVAAQLPDGCTICFVGDGPWLERIHSEHHNLISSGKVVTLGQRSDVGDVLRASDAFLFATLHENLSNALLEAMSLGLPTVVTDVGGNPEVVVHGETGFLVAPRDAQSMAAHLVELRDDPELRLRMGECGRSRIDEAFSQENIYRKIASLYDHLLSRRGPSHGRASR